MSKPISQREARRLRARVRELEFEKRANNRQWSSEYPGGVNIDTIHVSEAEWHIIRTARALGHAVVVKPSDVATKVYVYGVKV